MPRQCRRALLRKRIILFYPTAGLNLLCYFPRFQPSLRADDYARTDMSADGAMKHAGYI